MGVLVSREPRSYHRVHKSSQCYGLCDGRVLPVLQQKALLEYLRQAWVELRVERLERSGASLVKCFDSAKANILLKMAWAVSNQAWANPCLE
jgi:hypothetical protein